MNAKELRIGNIVGYADGGGFTELCAFEIHYIDIGKIAVKPIQLTEEWLLKFGFEKKSIAPMFSFYTKSGIILDVGYSIEGSSVSFASNHSTNRIKIKYVNQLQNLYFALVGEELTINN